jgi:hypothetical protein
MTSLVGILLMLIILGVLGAVAVSAVDGTGSPSSLPSSTSTVAGSSGTSGGDIQAALNAACVADYETLSAAVQVYATLHGINPAAGTSWVAGIEAGSSLLQSWPGDPGHFTFTWNGTSISVVPHHGASSAGSAGSSASATGCFAPLT